MNPFAFFKKWRARPSAYLPLGIIRAVMAVLLVAVASNSQAAIPASERQVLLDIYNMTDGSNWLNNTGWSDPPGTECGWYGVMCNVAETNVLWIELPFNGLSGPLPSLTDLSQLQLFDVSANGVSGTIPDLPVSLDTLNVSDTLIAGSIPDLQALPNLRFFLARSAQFTGTIPPLSGLGSLVVINVAQNTLEGTLPELSNLPALESFIVAGNQLQGTIPDLGDLPSLVTVDVANNSLTGGIPELNNHPDLRFFFADSNQLTGSIPEISGLAALQIFSVSDNWLTGSIPSLSGLSSLSIFIVSNNQLTGGLPDLSDAGALFQFEAEDNRLVGSIPSLADLGQLNAVLLADNNLTGAVPLIGEANLAPGESSLCGNRLASSGDAALDEAWETATGEDWVDCQISTAVPIDSPWMLALLISLMAGLGAACFRQASQ